MKLCFFDGEPLEAISKFYAGNVGKLIVKRVTASAVLGLSNFDGFPLEFYHTLEWNINSEYIQGVYVDYLDTIKEKINKSYKVGGAMGKIYLTSINGDLFSQCLIGDGKMLKFALGGKFLGEFFIDYNIGTLQEVDIVSILVVEGTVEVAYNMKGTFNKCVPTKDIPDIINFFNQMQGIVFTGRRQGQLDGVTFSQYFYAFRVNTLHESTLRGGLGV